MSIEKDNNIFQSEKNRDYPNIEFLRQQAEINLNEGVGYLLKDLESYYESKDFELHPELIQTINYYQKYTNTKEESNE